MANKPASFTQADVKRVIKAARKAGAAKVEVRLGDQAAFTIHLHDENMSLEAPSKVVL
jgi:hypothetical protein